MYVRVDARGYVHGSDDCARPRMSVDAFMSFGARKIGSGGLVSGELASSPVNGTIKMSRFVRYHKK